jgi:hypothetical protein
MHRQCPFCGVASSSRACQRSVGLGYRLVVGDLEEELALRLSSSPSENAPRDQRIRQLGLEVFD